MRTVFALALGIVSGAVATVLLFTFNGTFDGDAAPPPHVGNVRLVLDARALAMIVDEGLLGTRNGVHPPAEVSVRGDGYISVGFAVSPSGAGPRGTLVLNPEVREGRLAIDVVEANLVGTTHDAIASAVEQGLRSRLASLAGDGRYRVLTIATTGGRLTLEIEL